MKLSVLAARKYLVYMAALTQKQNIVTNSKISDFFHLSSS